MCAASGQTVRHKSAVVANDRALVAVSDRQLGTNVRQDDGSLLRWILIFKNILTAPNAGHVYLRAANGQRCAAAAPTQPEFRGAPRRLWDCCLLGNTTFAPPKFTLAANGRQHPCAARGQQFATNGWQEVDAILQPKVG